MAFALCLVLTSGMVVRRVVFRSQESSVVYGSEIEMLGRSEIA